MSATQEMAKIMGKNSTYLVTLLLLDGALEGMEIEQEMIDPKIVGAVVKRNGHTGSGYKVVSCIQRHIAE